MDDFCNLDEMINQLLIFMYVKWSFKIKKVDYNHCLKQFDDTKNYLHLFLSVFILSYMQMFFFFLLHRVDEQQRKHTKNASTCYANATALWQNVMRYMNIQQMFDEDWIKNMRKNKMLQVKNPNSESIKICQCMIMILLLTTKK